MNKSILYVWLPASNKIFPLGPVTLANHIHLKKIKVAQHILDLSLVPPAKRSIVLESTIKGFDPDIISFSWRDIQIFAPHQEDSSLEFAMDFFVYNGLCKWIRASFAGFKALMKYNSLIKENLGYINESAIRFKEKSVLVGGGAFSVFADQLIGSMDESITGVIGEGESVLVKILESRSIENERYVNSIQSANKWSINSSTVSIYDTAIDVDYISSIFRQNSQYRNSVIGIETKRGCPYSCQFCIYPYIEGNRVRLKDPKTIITTMSSFYNKWGSNRFWFADAQFIPGSNYIPHCEDILEMLIFEKMDIEWSGYIRTSLITESLARLLVKSGVTDLEVSITTGSQAIIDDLQLGFSLDEIYRGVAYLKEAGYKRKLILNYSLNTPGADIQSLKDCIASYKKIVSIIGEEQVIPFIFFLGIQPNTVLEKKLLKSKYLKEGYNPLSLKPQNAAKLLYNPPPLSKILARGYSSAIKCRPDQRGKALFKYLENSL